MNRIEVKMHKSKFSEAEHLSIFVDAKPLDKLLFDFTGDKGLIGLVPSLLKWDMVENERSLIQRRLRSVELETCLPILLCPDDFDLWCTKVIVLVKHYNDNVLWRKVGIDNTNQEKLIESIENVGSDVNWFNCVPEFKFDRNQYIEEINKFKYF